MPPANSAGWRRPQLSSGTLWFKGFQQLRNAVHASLLTLCWWPHCGLNTAGRADVSLAGLGCWARQNKSEDPLRGSPSTSSRAWHKPSWESRGPRPQNRGELAYPTGSGGQGTKGAEGGNPRPSPNLGGHWAGEPLTAGTLDAEEKAQRGQAREVGQCAHGRRGVDQAPEGAFGVSEPRSASMDGVPVTDVVSHMWTLGLEARGWVRGR